MDGSASPNVDQPPVQERIRQRPTLHLTVSVVVTIIGACALAAADTRHAGVAEGLKLQSVRRSLAEKTAGSTVSSVGALDLAGFEWYREVDLGNRLHVIAVSGNPDSALLLFQEEGGLVALERIDQPTWLTIFDFDGDGRPELVTEETIDRGTGILARAFAVYQVSPSGITKLWSAESYFREATWSDRAQRFLRRERRSFIRLEDRQLRYVRIVSGRPRETILELREGKLQGVNGSLSP